MFKFSFFLTCTLFFSSLFSSEVILKEKLAQAPIGSYFVVEQNKSYTFLHVHDIQGACLMLEEVSIPNRLFQKQNTTWKEWFEGGAPSNTSWTVSKVNLQTGKFEQTYSFTKGGWIDLSQDHNFLTTLLNLHFQRLPEEKRRKIGLAPPYHKQDLRPVWNPKLILEGTPIQNATFSVWVTRWPADGSELSKKIIEIYLPEETPLSCFPTWLEIEGKIGTAHVRLVDSGKEAISPKKFRY